MNSKNPPPRLVVGVGASAGGLEAFKQLLSALPGETGMAFVLVQHLDPTYKSLLTELLAPCTAMVVKEAEQGERLAPDVVYVIPSDASLAVHEGKIELTPPMLQRGARLSVDHLFRSLARDFGPRAVGIILSGAGSDGTAGLRDIKRAGGLIIVQDPSTGSQTGMPQSAIDTGSVDLVLPISQIPAALERFDKLPPSARQEPPVELAVAEAPSVQAELDDAGFSRLATLLESNTGFDLRVYKGGTVSRRVYRRMAISGHDGLDKYLEHLRQDPLEQKSLIRDLLISVTDFIRDAEAFDVLRTSVVEPLVDAAQQGETLRVWVPGCATGEEAYSLAMEFLAAAESRSKRITLQLFATDVDQDALTVGRHGHYPPNIADHIPADRLQKYFLPLNGRGFQVRGLLRDTVSFAAHDLTKDPPFSRMHLVSCRNVLIYLRASAQEQVLKAFHFALLPSGYLFLGSSETTGPQRDLFSTISKAWRIYHKVSTARSYAIITSGPRLALPNSSTDGEPARPALPETGRMNRRPPGVGELARRLVMQARVPPSIVISENGIVLFMHGELRPFLHFPEGEPRFELASLVTPNLATRTRAALYKCRRDQETVIAYSSPDGDQGARTKITATPAFELGDGTVILSFEHLADSVAPSMPAENPAQETVIEQLEKELHATREDLRNTVEELESSNEEMRSANEEAMSMNEELQSANEELEATTEELRSLNEELTTVNAQLREKIEQVERAHDDLSNFFESTKIATMFLDERLIVKRFTPSAQELLRVDHGDEGRFVGDIARELLHNGLAEDAQEVLSHLTPKTREVFMQNGRWITRRVLPYKTENRRIEGVVVTWGDITELKAATEALAIRERQQAIVARLSIRALVEPELQRFLDQAVCEIQQTLKCDYCQVLEAQPGGELLVLRAGAGWSPESIGQVAFPIGLDTQDGFTLHTKGPVFVKDYTLEHRFARSSTLVEREIRSGLSIVIGSSDEPYGVLSVHSRAVHEYTNEDANFLQACAALLAASIVRHEARVRMIFERAVAEALAEAHGLPDAVSRIHAAVVLEIGAGVTELWQPGPSGALERSSLFVAPPLSEGQVVEKFGSPYPDGTDSCIGRVAARKRAEWISSLQSLQQFSRVKAAQALGLTSGFVLPILVSTELVAVLAFFFKGRIHGDSAFLRTMEGIGRSIGEFIRRSDMERRFQTTMEAAPSGIADRSLEGRFLWANRRFCQITGYKLEELLSQSFQSITHPDDLAQEDRLFAELRRGQRERFEIEKRYIRKDGASVWVSLSAALVTTASGKNSYCIVIVDDISGRKSVEPAQRK